VVPAGTPGVVAEQLRSDILATLGTTEVRGRAEQAGFDITPSTPQGVRDRIDADTALYAPLIAEGRIARL
jgi:tripartite-type tricarboxylate transporter receptor subunit TctC